MKALKIGIVEDEIIIADTIDKLLTDIGYQTTEPAATYAEAIEMLANEKPDLVLLDIQLKGQKDGIELAKKINEDYKIPFIFLTANADAATVQRAKQVNPPAYLTKPFNRDDLYSSIEICFHNYCENNKANATNKIIVSDSIFIKEGNYFQKIMYADILYLESEHVYVHVVSRERKILVRSSLHQYLTNFDSNKFFRIHRSFVVNVQHIKSINTDNIILSNQMVLPIGKLYREELLSHLKLG